MKVCLHLLKSCPILSDEDESFHDQGPFFPTRSSCGSPRHRGWAVVVIFAYSKFTFHIQHTLLLNMCKVSVCVWGLHALCSWMQRWEISLTSDSSSFFFFHCCHYKHLPPLRYSEKHSDLQVLWSDSFEKCIAVAPALISWKDFPFVICLLICIYTIIYSALTTHSHLASVNKQEILSQA